MDEKRKHVIKLGENIRIEVEDEPDEFTVATKIDDNKYFLWKQKLDGDMHDRQADLCLMNILTNQIRKSDVQRARRMQQLEREKAGLAPPIKMRKEDKPQWEQAKKEMEEQNGKETSAATNQEIIEDKTQ